MIRPVLCCRQKSNCITDLDQDHWSFPFVTYGPVQKILVLFTLCRELSGRVLDSRPRGRGLEPHQCRCIVSLSKTHLS